MAKKTDIMFDRYGLLPRNNPPDDKGPPKDEQVQWCIRWLRKFAEPRKTINTNRSSYGLKHDVESWTKEFPEGRQYIPNGAFIAAALAEGYRVVPVAPNNINAHFNIRLLKTPKADVIDINTRTYR